jgi:hypothetical protein
MPGFMPFRFPESPFVLNDAAREFERGDYRKALDHFLSLVHMEPQHPAGWSGAARCYLALGDPRAALEGLNKVLQLDPSFLPDWGMKGQALLALGDAVDSLPCFDHVIASDPAQPQAYLDKIRALVELKDWAAVVDTFESYRHRGFVVNTDVAAVVEDARHRIPASKPPSPREMDPANELRAARALKEGANLKVRAAAGFTKRGDPTGAARCRDTAIDAYKRAAAIFLKVGDYAEVADVTATITRLQS